MMLTKIAPGDSVESIRDEVGWNLRVASDLSIIEPPEVGELAIIREQLDPQGLYR
jgi:glutaconate CoA-transferase subunit B